MKKIDLTMNEKINDEIKAPLWMLLELTHKCPLECPYCYNQLDFAKIDDKMKKEDWLKAIEKDGLTWHHVGDLTGWDNSAAKLYGIRAIPMNFLIDPQGKIIAKNLHGNALGNLLKTLL